MKIVQLIRANTAESDAQIFPEGVVTYDSEAKNLRAHDGLTPGGNTIVSEADVNAFGTQEFTAVTVDSTPGQMLDAVVGQFVTISAAGAYQLPSAAGKPVGSRLTIQATVAGVTLEPFLAQFISDLNVDLSTTTISQNQIVSLAVKDSSKWVIVGRY